MSKRKLRYGHFANRIDVDEFEQAIGFDPIKSTHDEDTGHCFDFFGLHTHGDTTGKLSINREKRVYNCWVCGGGSLLDLTMNKLDVDAEAATEWLAQFAGEETSEEGKDRLLTNLKSSRKKEDRPLPYFNEHVLERYKKEHPFFRKRGITPEVIDEYKLRFNPKAVKRAPKGKDKDDYIGPSIILPHFWQGKLVGWQQRWLKEDRPKWVAKYTNTPDFPRDRTLFNYDSASRSKLEVVVVESVTTALFLESIGQPCVATFGASVTDEQIKLLRRFTQGLLLAFDNDGAGLAARNVVTEALHGRYLDCYHVPFLDDAKADLGDLARRPNEVFDLLERAYLPLTKTLMSMKANSNT